MGDRIRALRKELNLSQKQLASILGIKASTIGMYEQNRRIPNNDIVVKMASVFNVSTDYLLGKDSLSEPHNPQIDELINIVNMMSDDEIKQVRNFAAFIVSRR